MKETRPKKLRVAFEWHVVKRALYTSVIVGTLLVLINHGGNIWSGRFGMAELFQSALTFVVPYLVSTVSSVQATFERNPEHKKQLDHTKSSNQS